MTRHSQHFVAALVFILATLAASEAALAQEAGTEREAGRERVLSATEGEPALLRNEIVRMYDAAKRTTGFRDFYDPVCIALGYLGWRRDNPGEFPGLDRFRNRDEHGRISACADHDRIVSSTNSRVERLLTGRTKGPGARLPQDQVRRIAACTAELMADRYLENPGPNPPNRGHQSEIYVSAFNECQPEHGAR
jgi:hypothetical protein